MPAITKNRISFADYLTYFDDSDTKHELVDGEMTAMAVGTGLHGEAIDRIYRAMNAEIERIAQPWIARQGQIGVRCPRGLGLDTARIPDVVVMLHDDWLGLQEREAVIGFDMSPPLLVMEVVSASTKSTDYRAKRTEYAARDIPEYWIVDPLESKISVLVLLDGWYDITTFYDGDRLLSPLFPELQLTPAQIFNL